jgi:putative endonuclease
MTARDVHPPEVRIDIVGVLRPRRGATGIDHLRGIA